jgi:hypothetical protein
VGGSCPEVATVRRYFERQDISQQLFFGACPRLHACIMICISARGMMPHSAATVEQQQGQQQTLSAAACCCHDDNNSRFVNTSHDAAPLARCFLLLVNSHAVHNNLRDDTMLCWCRSLGSAPTARIRTKQPSLRRRTARNVVSTHQPDTSRLNRDQGLV